MLDRSMLGTAEGEKAKCILEGVRTIALSGSLPVAASRLGRAHEHEQPGDRRSVATGDTIGGYHWCPEGKDALLAFLSRAVSEIDGLHLPQAVTDLKDEGGSYHPKPRNNALCCITPGLA
jgi:hypothetical protein